MSSSPSAWSGRGWRRSPFCLIAALCWALLPVSWPRVGVSVGAGSYLALVGTGVFTLLLVALSFDDARRAEAPRMRRSLSLGLGLACVPSAAFAHALAVATHHRPLGAATFSVFAFGSGALGVWVAHRAQALAAGSRAGEHLLRACRALALLGVTALAFVLVRGLLRQEIEGGSALAVEVVAGVGLSALMLALPVTPRLAQAARWTTPACVLLCLFALGLIRFEADVRATVKSAPAIAGALGLALR